MAFGISIKDGEGGKRIEMECMHQNGLLYVVPSESSWVCSADYLEAHALAGFFRELVNLEAPGVRDLMQKWGIYFRPRPLKEQDSSNGRTSE